MIGAEAFIGPALTRGFQFYAGVPCSFLTPLINRVIGDPALGYVGATSEGEAVAMAAGAWLAGRKTVVMCQNSGLGNAVNPLTSLNFPFRIPTLLIVTWRGQPGIGDEPQHELMGRITAGLFDTMGIPHQPFPAATEEVEPSLALAESELVPGTLVAFGDIVLKRHIIQALLEEAGDGVTLIVDSGLAGADVADRVHADHADSGRISFAETRLQAIGDVDAATSHGAWIGLLHLGRDGAGWLRQAVDAVRKDGTLPTARLADLITRVLAAGRPVRVVYTRGGWVNVNNLRDLLDAGGV